MDKKSVRQTMIRRRDSLTLPEREKYSEVIAERLLKREEYARAKVVLSYASFRSEVVTDRINRQVIEDGKALYLPKTYMDLQKMVFYRVKDLDTDLVSGAMGIREPAGGEALDLGLLTISLEQVLVIVPGVAFDEKGYRMGYGGGFYDRFFSGNPELNRRSIFLAYEIQKAESLPAEPTDIRLKHILTESHFYDILVD